MNGDLRAAVDRALADPATAEAESLHLSYSRGHALSGMTRLDVGGAGRYEIHSDETMGRHAVSFAGTLDEGARATLLRSILEHGVLSTTSSARNLADDEVPVIVSVRSGDRVHEIRIWDGDAKANPTFHAFETELLALVATLSGGAILTSAR